MIFHFLSAQHAPLIHHSAHVCGICGKNKHSLCCIWSTALVFFVCVCALVCECNVCLFSCLPDCLCTFSLKVTFVCGVCFSFVYQHILCLRAGKQQYAKALSCLISLAARLFHHPNPLQASAERDGPWLRLSESCACHFKDAAVHFFLFFFLHTTTYFSVVW